ncbi:MAG: peptidoglycan editing factor PgeF [Nitrospirae bacterium]|nr:peptidoglycan editing factor PgeF [Nitrospirota bacterium]
MTKYGIITLPAFAGEDEGVRHFFGTRHHSGHPAVGRGSSGLASSEPVIVVSVEQVHGTDALVLDRPVKRGETFPGNWDALMTNQTGLLLTVRTADCVPVLVYDPVRMVAAAVHAGWRGAVAGIVPRTLSVMRRQFGSKPGSLQVGIGPSVGPCCYEVDEPVLSQLRVGFPDWRSVVRATGKGKALLDLRALVRRQAQAAGVDEGHIRSVNLCTVCHPDLFYSYRREGTVNGTMISGIMLTRHKKR